jgi:quercetin dioxygenase-like cupin family protein
MSRAGETLVDIRDATVTVLSDRPELVVTHARLRPEGGPPSHVHAVHADCFAVLDGELSAQLGDGQHEFGAGTLWAAPPGVVHGYRHDSTDEVRFLNLHAPGMGFADYLFGERKAEEADQFEPPPDGGRPAGDAVVLRFESEGETITDEPGRTVRLLVDLPEIVVTWTRYSHGEAGPDPHLHREHVDAFFILDGELLFEVGSELEPVTATAGTFLLAPPELVHTFRNESGADARWLNFHAPSAGFAEFLRNTDLPWDSFDAPAGSGRPAGEAIVQHVHPA